MAVESPQCYCYSTFLWVHFNYNGTVKGPIKGLFVVLSYVAKQHLPIVLPNLAFCSTSQHRRPTNGSQVRVPCMSNVWAIWMHLCQSYIHIIAASRHTRKAQGHLKGGRRCCSSLLNMCICLLVYFILGKRKNSFYLVLTRNLVCLR